MTDTSPSSGRYTRLAMLLHWLTAALVIGNVLIVWTVDFLPDDFARPMIDTHKSMGITVLGLSILRLLWRFGNPPPAFPDGYAKWEQRAAHAAHGLLYALLFLMPLSGWMHDSAWNAAASHPMYFYGLFEWPRLGFIMAIDPATKERLHDLFGLIHTSFGYVLYGVLALHVLGALKHQVFDGEAEMQRILPWGRTR